MKLNTQRVRDGLAWLLFVIGLLTMAGDLLGNRAMKGLGASTAMAPCPKVFSDANGLEGFASSFKLISEAHDGAITELEITPEVYAKLSGPYNLRNSYGAALSFAPRLPEALWRSVAHHGLREGGSLQRELGLPPNAKRTTIVITTRTRGRHDVWKFVVPSA